MGWIGWRYKVERRLARFLARRPLSMPGREALVSFTFDDVPQSACREGRDLLERHGVRGTYYACGGLTDTVRADAPFHSRADLASLLERGHELGCHGFLHRDYQTLSATEIEDDLARNRAFFRELGCEDRVTSFAYPYGCVSPQIKRLVGPRYGSARGVWRGINERNADAALLRGEPLYESLWQPATLTALIERNARRKGWLIFFTHGVVDQPDAFGCRPATLDLALRESIASGACVLPVGDALRRLGAG